MTFRVGWGWGKGSVFCSYRKVEVPASLPWIGDQLNFGRRHLLKYWGCMHKSWHTMTAAKTDSVYAFIIYSAMNLCALVLNEGCANSVWKMHGWIKEYYRGFLLHGWIKEYYPVFLLLSIVCRPLSMLLLPNVADAKNLKSWAYSIIEYDRINSNQGLKPSSPVNSWKPGRAWSTSTRLQAEPTTILP